MWLVNAVSLQYIVEITLLNITANTVVSYEETFSMTYDMPLQVNDFEAVSTIIKEEYSKTVTGNNVQ